MSLPSAVQRPCNECPWRRASAPGYLGPKSAREWARMAHTEAAIACHKTIRDTDAEGIGDWDHPAMRQCRGAAIFRANVHKQPRSPDVAAGPSDTETIFATDSEFIRHHETGGTDGTRVP